MNTTKTVRAERWLELIVEDSYNEDMASLEFVQVTHLLIDLLHNMIAADEAILQARHVAEQDDIVREIRNDDMAAWLGVNRKDLQSR
tara:strand:+ start:77 stop:337 length:261 start_codon:yes stop_codon:yes gene_type:complete